MAPFDGLGRRSDTAKVAQRKARPKRPVVKVQHLGDGILNVSPIMDAFETMTGEDYRDHIQSFRVIEGAIRAVIAPTPALTKWLHEAASPWIRFDRNARVHYVLSILQRALQGYEFEKLRAGLALHEEAFSKLSQSNVESAFALLKPGKTTGATNHGIPSVAAELTLKVKAFGFEKKTGKDWHRERERVANALRNAEARHMKATRTRV